MASGTRHVLFNRPAYALARTEREPATIPYLHHRLTRRLGPLAEATLVRVDRRRHAGLPSPMSIPAGFLMGGVIGRTWDSGAGGTGAPAAFFLVAAPAGHAPGQILVHLAGCRWDFAELKTGAARCPARLSNAVFSVPSKRRDCRKPSYHPTDHRGAGLAGGAACGAPARSAADDPPQGPQRISALGLSAVIPTRPSF